MDSGLIKELLKLTAAFGVGYALASSTTTSTKEKSKGNSPEVTSEPETVAEKPATFTVIENPKESIPQFVSPVTIDPTTTSPVASN